MSFNATSEMHVINQKKSFLKREKKVSFSVLGKNLKLFSASLKRIPFVNESHLSIGEKRKCFRDLLI